MRRQLNYFLGIALLIALVWGCAYTSNQEEVLAIKDYRKQAAPEDKLEGHSSGDVEIYRSIFMGEGYSVNFYSDYTGELISHNAFYGSEEDFDQAKYKWKNDTTVIIGLINSNTDTEISFEVFGKGNATGMSTDE
ncbi:MAG: hypothetical protein QNK30_12690 [Bacteroidales bacterium]|nr:hypothetical protein [Bacteroidales bacterium]